MDRQIPDLAINNTGLILNLGAGNKSFPQAIPLDLPEWDYHDGIPYPDESVSMIHAYHFMEHVDCPVKMLLEIQRVLMPGGVANIVVPYYNSQMQAQDLDHKSQYCEMTWKTLFANPYYDKNRVEWKLDVGLNIIIGIVERNLCLMTQLIKR